MPRKRISLCGSRDLILILIEIKRSSHIPNIYIASHGGHFRRFPSRIYVGLPAFQSGPGHAFPCPDTPVAPLTAPADAAPCMATGDASDLQPRNLPCSRPSSTCATAPPGGRRRRGGPAQDHGTAADRRPGQGWSPAPCTRNRGDVATGTIEHLDGCFEAAWLDDVWLVIAATDDPEVNREVAARPPKCAGSGSNVVDDTPLCGFQVPARIERGPLQIAISSGGGAPMLARHLREKPRNRDSTPPTAHLAEPAGDAIAERIRETPRGHSTHDAVSSNGVLNRPMCCRGCVAGETRRRRTPACFALHR